MKKSKLSEHIFEKGVFRTSWSEFLNPVGEKNSWFYSRLPEYLWLGLILFEYDRQVGLKKCYQIIIKLHDIDKNISLPKWSSILCYW